MKRFIYTSLLSIVLVGMFAVMLPAAGPSNYHSAGNFTSLILGVKTVTGGNYTVAGGDYFIRVASVSQRTVTLPPARATGRVIIVKQVSTGGVIISPNGSDTIEGAATATLVQSGTSLTFVDGISGNWDKQ